MEKGYEQCVIMDDETSWRSHVPANMGVPVDSVGHDDIDFEQFIKIITSCCLGGDTGGREKDSLRLNAESQKLLAERMRWLSPLFRRHFMAAIEYADKMVGRDNWCIRVSYATDETELVCVIAYRATCVRIADMRVTFNKNGTGLSASHAALVPRFLQDRPEADYFNSHIERGIYAANWTTESMNADETQRKARWNAFIKWETHVKKMWPTFYAESQRLYQKLAAAREAHNSYMELYNKKMKKYAEICDVHV